MPVASALVLLMLELELVSLELVSLELELALELKPELLELALVATQVVVESARPTTSCSPQPHTSQRQAAQRAPEPALASRGAVVVAAGAGPAL